MAIVTLTSDMGLKDHYVAILKGKILSKVPHANIVDLSHDISPFNITEAAFIVKNSFTYFPDDTVHLISVHSQNKSIAKCVAIKYKKQFFAGIDGGIFSLITDTHPDEIVEIDKDIHSASPFITKDILVDAVCKILTDNSLVNVGNKVNSIESKTFIRAPDNAYIMKGAVVYIDRFGNVILNITKDKFEKIRDNRSFIINYRRQEKILSISNTYADVSLGEKLCFFNTSGHMEIAINEGNASELLGLHMDDVIQIEFE